MCDCCNLSMNVIVCLRRLQHVTLPEVINKGEFVFRFTVRAHRARITYHSITKQLNRGTKCNIETASPPRHYRRLRISLRRGERQHVLKFNRVKSNRWTRLIDLLLRAIFRSLAHNHWKLIRLQIQRNSIGNVMRSGGWYICRITYVHVKITTWIVGEERDGLRKWNNTP